MSEKQTFYDILIHNNKDLSRFVEKVCENVSLYHLKSFPFNYRNAETEKYVFYVHVESIYNIVFVLLLCDRSFK